MSRPIFIPVEAHSPEWHAVRRTGVGGSEIAIITGDAPWGDVVTLYQEKLNLNAAAVPSRAMEVGTRFEDAIRRWYAEDAGEKVNRVRGIYRHPEIPFLIASLDSLTVRRPRRVVQIKVADSLGDEWGADGTDEIPDHYREQIEWEMLASGTQLATLVVFVVRQRRLAVFHAARDEALSASLIRYASDFWACVEQRVPPDPPGDRGRVVRLRRDEIDPDEDLIHNVLLHARMQEELTALEGDLEKVKARLRERLLHVGGTRGTLPDGRAFSVLHRPNKPSRSTRWELLFNEMRQRLLDAGADEEELEELVDDYTTVSPGARPLRVTIQKEKRSRAA